MAIIDIKKEQNEISLMLSKFGCEKADHHFILDRLKTNQEAHLRYLNNARKENKKE